MTNDSQSRDIAGRYRLREALSKRPVGRWFRAHDREADVEVGLLLMNPELLPDEDSQNRFIGAVVEMRGINHRHLLKLFDVGREGGSVYLTTQLSQPIRALYKSEGVLDYVNSVADGLDAVHRAGQTHGRLTPSDICEVQGLIKVGGAGLYNEIKSSLAMRVWRGLSCFWAPEVIRGERPTPATDVYSLAAIASVLLNNGKASDPHQALAALEAENAAVFDALSPALSVAPDDRPASPSLLVNRLANALDDDEIDEQPTTYFVKSDLEENGPSADQDRTVLDVNVPAAIANATPAKSSNPPSSTMNATAAAVREAVAAKRQRIAGPSTPAAYGKRKSSKNIHSKAHESTVVDATTLPKDAEPGPRKVPAMVSMGPPVGPSSTRKRPIGKTPAGKTTEKTAIPTAMEGVDPTERMSAAHRAQLEGARTKAPPAVANQSWVARANATPTARSAPVDGRSRRDDPSERATTTPRVGPENETERPRASANAHSAGKGQVQVRQRRVTPEPSIEEHIAEELASSSREVPQRDAEPHFDRAPTRKGKGQSPGLGVAASGEPVSLDAMPPADAAVPVEQASPSEPALPSAPVPSAPVNEPSSAPISGPTALGSEYDELGHYAPPAGMQPPRGSTNLTWLYVIIAAVISATLAIFAAMALFGS